MDPTAALVAADQVISDCDLYEAIWLLTGYRMWRKKGGYEPLEVAGTLMHGDRFAAWCERRLDSQQEQRKFPSKAINQG